MEDAVGLAGVHVLVMSCQVSLSSVSQVSLRKISHEYSLPLFL
jgi:hypothetical protein